MNKYVYNKKYCKDECIEMKFSYSYGERYTQSRLDK